MDAVLLAVSMGPAQDNGGRAMLGMEAAQRAIRELLGCCSQKGLVGV